MDTGDKLMILIHALVGFSNRQLTERWQHSGSTISLYIHETITAMLQCKEFFFLDLKIYQPTFDKIQNFISTFKIVSLDGCHIAAVVMPDTR